MSGLSNHFDAMTAIQTIINNVGLPGFPVPTIQPVLNYKVPDMVYPIVLIAPWGPEDLTDATMSQDNPTYHSGVAIVLGDEKQFDFETFLGWRQTVRRRLNNVTIPVSGGYRFSVKPGPVVEPIAWLKDKKLVSTLIVSADFQEGRS